MAAITLLHTFPQYDHQVKQEQVTKMMVPISAVTSSVLLEVQAKNCSAYSLPAKRRMKTDSVHGALMAN